MSELPADYETLDDLSERGRELGAKEVSAIGIGWESGPGSCYQAQATVVTASGNKFGPISAWAEPGDSQAPDPPPADNDPFVRDRARIRATRAALKLAYGKDADATQPPHVRLVQMMVRNAAQARGLERDVVAQMVHELVGVTSLNDLDLEQAHRAEAWLRPWVTGEE